jgi:flagellar M-ring protein FliF
VEQKKNYFTTILEIFNKLSIQQRMLMGGLVILTVLLLIFVLFVFNEPNYVVLFGKLSQEDASKVVEYLNAQKIPYKVDDNESAIKVPKDKVYEARLALAGKGVPSSGIIGYEIFDKNTMGMSDFMQKLNYKRALEGELSRTIMQEAGIENARVHIVLPARSVFKDEQKEPTASVVLKLSMSGDLGKGNIQAISHLVASSVEGLKPENVTIVDTKGNLLSNPNDAANGGFSGKQYEIKSAIENYLANKAQSILDNVIGYGNSVVKINADIDFDQVEKTMELYDPESQVAISEQTVKSESGGKSISDSNVVTTLNSTTNYEVSKTIQKVIEGTGNIKRLTLAAVINGVPKEVKEGGDTKTVMEPRSEDQMKKLEQIISQAVGVNPVRNDQVSVVSMQFENQNNNDSPAGGSSFKFEQISNLIIAIVGILAAMMILKSLLKRLKNEKIIIGTVNYKDDDLDLAFAAPGAGSVNENGLDVMPKKTKRAPLIEVGDINDEITNEALEKKARQDKIVNYVQKNPVEAAKLINLWLREDEYE